MKILLVLASLFSLNTFAADADFRCSTPKSSGKTMEVVFENGTLTYDDGRLVQVSVASKSNNGKVQKVGGVSRGLIFAGGGSQSVNVTVNLKTKKGEITISTKTFYRSSETTHKLTCIL